VGKEKNEAEIPEENAFEEEPIVVRLGNGEVIEIERECSQHHAQ
jgi:hypothetical protein